MKVASLIVHYNLDYLTDKAVECLKNQSMRHDIYVFDAGSDTPYQNKKATVIRVPKSPGLAGALNRGMDLLQGKYDWVFQYTNDVEVPPDTLRSLVLLMKAYSDLAAAQPSMPSSHKHLRHLANTEWKAAPYLEWAAVLVSLIAWVDVGPLDEEFNFFSMDIDWCHRVIEKGWWLAVDHSIEAKHPFRGTHNVTGFSINAQAKAEHEHGKKKYGRDDWQEYLKGAL